MRGVEWAHFEPPEPGRKGPTTALTASFYSAMIWKAAKAEQIIIQVKGGKTGGPKTCGP